MSRAGTAPPVPKARPAGRAESTCSEYPPGAAELARRVVAVLGGRYSAELGIDADASDAEVERWSLAATLFGARISARVAERAFGVLAAAGLNRPCTAAAASSGPRSPPTIRFGPMTWAGG